MQGKIVSHPQAELSPPAPCPSIHTVRNKMMGLNQSALYTSGTISESSIDIPAVTTAIPQISQDLGIDDIRQVPRPWPKASARYGTSSPDRGPEFTS